MKYELTAPQGDLLNTLHIVKGTLSFLASWMLLVASTEAQIVNGSFEDGYAGWQVYEANLIGLIPGHSPTAEPAGVDGVIASYLPPGSTIAQIIRVQPGAEYTLSCHTACIRSGTRSMTALAVWTLRNERLALAPPLLDPCGQGYVEHTLSFVVPSTVSVVRVEFKGVSLGGGSTSVDNVRLLGPAAPAIPRLDVRIVNPDELELRWPASAPDYRLQATSDLSSWTDVDVSSASQEDGFWRLIVDQPAANQMRFYQLTALPPVEG